MYETSSDPRTIEISMRSSTDATVSPISQMFPSHIQVSIVLHNRAYLGNNCAIQYSFGISEHMRNVLVDCLIKVDANWGIFMIFLDMTELCIDESFSSDNDHFT